MLIGKKAIEEAFPNILTFTAHFTIKTSNNFLSFHYFVPTFFLIITTSTFPFLFLPSIFYLYLISSTSTKSNSTTFLTPVPTPRIDVWLSFRSGNLRYAGRTYSLIQCCTRTFNSSDQYPQSVIARSWTNFSFNSDLLMKEKDHIHYFPG